MKDIAKALNKIKKLNLPKTEFVQFMENIKNPFIVLIACILSLRTNDRTTYPATMRMLKIGKTIDDFAKLNPDVLEKAIYPVGFYKNKAKQIVQIAKELKENYNSIVPDEIEELIKFNGVGRKTANLVLAKGYNKPAICVDVHVHRISNRLGLVKTQTPEETEFALKENLDKNLWIDLNTEFVTFGQNICKPINPKCNECPLLKECENR